MPVQLPSGVICGIQTEPVELGLSSGDFGVYKIVTVEIYMNYVDLCPNAQRWGITAGLRFEQSCGTRQRRCHEKQSGAVAGDVTVGQSVG